MSYLRSALALTLLIVCQAWSHAGPDDFFCITVVDEATGRGVPLVELTTVHNVRFYTDSAGRVAIDEPELMHRQVYFHIQSHGYQYRQDGFGFRGERLLVAPGEEVTLRIQRINIAQRLYRLTGGGIYRDSLLAGKPVPIREPLINAEVFGCDSVVNANYRGQYIWLWGDTNRPSYPLGNFHASGARSQLPLGGGLDPAQGVDLDYFVGDDGFARPMAKMPGSGPTWITSLINVPSGDSEMLLAAYVKVEPPLTVYERGWARFNDERGEFEKLEEFPMDSPLWPEGHAFRHVEDGVDYVYFGNPFPLVRVRAALDSLLDPSQYQAYNCFQPGSRPDALVIDRDGANVHYRWKTDTVAFTPKLQVELIEQGKLDPQQGLFQLKNAEGKPILIHRGSVAWNEYRQRWIMIAVESFGTSALGEVWFAEAERLVGPWSGARKIVTHEQYSFYNPKHHPVFDQDAGRTIYFEGTYTTTFSGNDDPTPRYDYNQIMYRLDLGDPRLE